MNGEIQKCPEGCRDLNIIIQDCRAKYSYELEPLRRPLKDLAEMKAIDGQGDGQREEAGAFEQGPEKEPPVLDAFGAADAELVNGAP